MLEDTITMMERIGRFFTSTTATVKIADKILQGGVVKTSDPLGFSEDTQLLLAAALTDGSPYAVSADICDVLTVAAESLPPIPLTANLFPTQRGFVRWEKTIDLGFGPEVIERLNQDRIVKLTGAPRLCSLAWSITDKDGAILWFFVETVPPQPTPGLIWLTAQPFGESWDYSAFREKHGRPLMDSERMDAPYLTVIMRHLYTLLAFMGQKFIDTRPQVIANRQARKRAIALNGHADVNVVTLRKRQRKDPSGEHREVEW